jgi:hypothetical protein
MVSPDAQLPRLSVRLHDRKVMALISAQDGKADLLKRCHKIGAGCHQQQAAGCRLRVQWLDKNLLSRREPTRMKRRLIAMLVTLAAGIAVCQPPKDVSGWNNIKWGMTVAQAKTALGKQAVDAAPPGSPGSRFVDRLIVEGLHIGEIAAHAVVMSKRESDLVSHVNIGCDIPAFMSARADAFLTLKSLLIEKYRSPKSEDRKPGILDHETDVTVLWIFPATSITLSWDESPSLGFVTIRYMPTDKKALDVL